MAELPRRSVLKAVGAGTVLTVGGVGVAGAKGGRRKGASAEKNLVEKAIELNDSGPYAGQFDELIAAVTANPSVESALTDPDDQLTVFAPVDEGFENLGVAGADVSADVLLYHVTNGRRYESSVVNAPRLRMLDGGTVTVDGTLLNTDQAEIVATNVEASNGVIHAIGPVDGENGVLLP
jgi:uncharacterized surface protein with fasciclin (FAS1) repeats